MQEQGNGNVVTSSDSALVKYLEAKQLKLKSAEMAELAKFHLIGCIKRDGDIIFKDGDDYKIATVKDRESKTLNKPQLSVDTGIPLEELNILGLVELAERGELSKDVLEQYYEDSINESISIRKLKKEEVAKIFAKGGN